MRQKNEPQEALNRKRSQQAHAVAPHALSCGYELEWDVESQTFVLRATDAPDEVVATKQKIQDVKSFLIHSVRTVAARG